MTLPNYVGPRNPCCHRFLSRCVYHSVYLEFRSYSLFTMLNIEKSDSIICHIFLYWGNKNLSYFEKKSKILQIDFFPYPKGIRFTNLPFFFAFCSLWVCVIQIIFFIMILQWEDLFGKRTAWSLINFLNYAYFDI